MSLRSPHVRIPNLNTEYFNVLLDQSPQLSIYIEIHAQN